jgi:hypothetical protein
MRFTGTGPEFQLYDSVNASYFIKATHASGVELRYGNVKKFITDNLGVVVTGLTATDSLSIADRKVNERANDLRKNLIFNGDFQIWQYGGGDTSWTGIGNGDSGYFCDGWSYTETGAPVGVATYSKDTGYAGVDDMPFDQALKIDCTTAEDLTDVNHAAYIRTKLEAQFLQHLKYGTANAEDMTFSFWTKGNKAGTMTIRFRQNDPATNRYFYREVSLTGDGNWERVSCTVPGDTSGQIDNDTGIGFQINFILSAGASVDAATADAWGTDGTNYATANQTNFLDNAANDLWITGCQLEVGSVMTDNEILSYQDQLFRCQRYYILIGVHDDDTARVSFGVCDTESTSDATVVINLPQEMRGAVAAEYKAATDFRCHQSAAAVQTETVTVNYHDRMAVTIMFTDTGAGLTGGDSGLMETRSNTGEYLALESDL